MPEEEDQVERAGDREDHLSEDAWTSLRANEVFIALCAPLLLVLSLLIVTLVPGFLHPGTEWLVLGGGIVAQPVAALAIWSHRRSRRPQQWWSVWATALLTTLTLCVQDPAFRQTAVMSLVVGPLYAAMFTGTRSMLGHLLLAAGTSSTLVGVIDGSPLERLSRVLAVNMVLVLCVSGLFILRRRLDVAVERALQARDRADHLASHDPLTGLLNRRGLQTRLSARYPHPGAAGPAHSTGAALLDLDHFKRINDSLGHSMGDEVLVRIAAVLSASLRPGDLLARIGGEEFLVIVPDAELTTLTDLAERIRLAVSTDQGPVPVTVSVGVAVCTNNVAAPHIVDELYARADRLLYRAKANGRNQVCAEPAGGAAELNQKEKDPARSDGRFVTPGPP